MFLWSGAGGTFIWAPITDFLQTHIFLLLRLLHVSTDLYKWHVTWQIRVSLTYFRKNFKSWAPNMAIVGRNWLLHWCTCYLCTFITKMLGGDHLVSTGSYLFGYLWDGKKEPGKLWFERITDGALLLANGLCLHTLPGGNLKLKDEHYCWRSWDALK